MDNLEQRRDAIVTFVNEKGNVSFAELKSRFSEVSEMTLRTDLKTLDAARRIVRIHGGAKSVDVVVGTDDLLGRRQVRNVDEKQLIAEKAVGLIRKNASILLDSGSTATMLARIFPDQPNLIYTSGISCALELAKLERPKVYLPGGQMNRFSLSMYGPSGIEELSRVHFDLCFLGVTCYSEKTGFTCGSREEAELKKTMLRQSERVAVLMDSSKVETRSAFSICDLSGIDILVSDSKLPVEFLEHCEENEVTVI